MRQHLSWCVHKRAIGFMAVLGLLMSWATIASECRAVSPDDCDPPPRLTTQPEIRSGGVIEESYAYHRQPPASVVSGPRSIEPASGWYGYGFPVSTFRWGWFGAAHYYPTHYWHDGYYGDSHRYAYRRGY